MTDIKDEDYFPDFITVTCYNWERPRPRQVFSLAKPKRSKSHLPTTNRKESQQYFYKFAPAFVGLLDQQTTIP